MGSGATTSLYSYTPFFSGNRSFEDKFETWFGSPFTPSYSWQVMSQYAYTDSSKSTPANPASLVSGQRIYIGFTAKNTGNQTWSNSGANPVRVITSGPSDRQSSFCDSTWIACNRPAVMQEASVAPGGTGTFEFWYKTPGRSFTGYEQFNLVAEGLALMNDPQMSFYTVVSPPIYSWQVMSQYAYTDSSKSTPANPASLVSGQRIYIGFTAKNTGNQTWTKTNSNPVRVMTSGPNDHDSPFCDSTWLGCNRPTGMQENSVAPGGTATFEFWYKTPAHGFSGYEQYSLLAEGLTPLNDPQMSFYTVVSPPIYSWQLTSQYAYTDATKTTPADPANLISGQRIYVGLTAKNTGNQTWSNSGANPVHVGTSGPLDRQSSFCDSTWLGCNRPAVMQEASVAPGGTATFEFWYKTPAGGYGGYEQFRPMVEGIGWMNDPQMSFYTVVAAPAYAWQLTGEYAYTDATKTTGANPAALHKGDRIYVGFTAKNIGNQTWTNTGNNPISTGTWGPIDHTSKFCDTTWLACNRPTRLKEASVPPGGNGTFEFWYKAPSNTFTGYEQFNLVVEGYNWMPSVGMSYYSVVN
jgi:hypothetical protein